MSPVEFDLNEKERQAKILIVDDNPSNVILLKKILAFSGYVNIETTTDSRDVINIYKEFRPDLILLDLEMPHLDGFKILEDLNSLKQEDYLSVMIITSQSDKENRLKALKMGAKDYINKPFDHAEILMRIKNMLEIRVLHNQANIQNHVLEEKVQQRTSELRDLQLELIQRLLRAAEFRDNDTGSHIKRIGQYCSALAKEAGLSNKFCDLIEHAAMMHDIGKIAIPDEILLKQGRLTPGEWEKIKMHTIKGSQILTGSPYDVIQLAEEIALTHHEKWDGSGYPNGLASDEIPISGRITAICDVFDALLSERPYKKAWSLEKVIKEMKDQRGLHFDPSLIDSFFAILPDILKIREQYK